MNDNINIYNPKYLRFDDMRNVIKDYCNMIRASYDYDADDCNLPSDYEIDLMDGQKLCDWYSYIIGCNNFVGI